MLRFSSKESFHTTYAGVTAAVPLELGQQAERQQQ
jgi:hypothetical protein